MPQEEVGICAADETVRRPEVSDPSTLSNIDHLSAVDNWIMDHAKGELAPLPLLAVLTEELPSIALPSAADPDAYVAMIHDEEKIRKLTVPREFQVKS